MDISVTLTGYVGGDIESRSTKSGLPMATFRVGTTPRIRRDNEWTDGPTTWVSVTCFRALADNVAASLHKGDPVIVSGRFRTQAWVDAGNESHERLVLEAAQVGHDLTRGRSRFERTRRPIEEPGVVNDVPDDEELDVAA
jgi:single-strand DNA-binding protein